MHQERLLLPQALVEKALEECQPLRSISGRDGLVRTIGAGELHWHNLGGAREVYEPLQGKLRPATVQDVIDSARLLDALDQATIITPFFTPTDVPGVLMSLAMYRHICPIRSNQSMVLGCNPHLRWNTSLKWPV